MPGAGPTWLSGYISLPDARNTPHLVASYVKIKPPMDAYERGLCVWNEQTERFDRQTVIWIHSSATPTSPAVPEGQPVFWRDSQGVEWVLFGNPLPTLRCPARYESWTNAATWEVLTPQAELATVDGDKKVKPHSGSIAWNGFRKRWVTVFVEAYGKPSFLGEVWYAEAAAPTGPWGPAIKVLSHSNYTFYNPRLHPEFTPVDSPILIFEGTYTKEFADRPNPTARYDYNQVMYRLDLDDPALRPAQATQYFQSHTRTPGHQEENLTRGHKGTIGIWKGIQSRSRTAARDNIKPFIQIPGRKADREPPLSTPHSPLSALCSLPHAHLHRYPEGIDRRRPAIRHVLAPEVRSNVKSTGIVVASGLQPTTVSKVSFPRNRYHAHPPIDSPGTSGRQSKAFHLLVPRRCGSRLGPHQFSLFWAVDFQSKYRRIRTPVF
jgi:hypothetical protein